MGRESARAMRAYPVIVSCQYKGHITPIAVKKLNSRRTGFRKDSTQRAIQGNFER